MLHNLKRASIDRAVRMQDGAPPGRRSGYGVSIYWVGSSCSRPVSDSSRCT